MRVKNRLRKRRVPRVRFHGFNTIPQSRKRVTTSPKEHDRAYHGSARDDT